MSKITCSLQKPIIAESVIILIAKAGDSIKAERNGSHRRTKRNVNFLLVPTVRVHAYEWFSKYSCECGTCKTHQSISVACTAMPATHQVHCHAAVFCVCFHSAIFVSTYIQHCKTQRLQIPHTFVLLTFIVAVYFVR